MLKSFEMLGVHEYVYSKFCGGKFLCILYGIKELYFNVLRQIMKKIFIFLLFLTFFALPIRAVGQNNADSGFIRQKLIPSVACVAVGKLFTYFAYDNFFGEAPANGEQVIERWPDGTPKELVVNHSVNFNSRSNGVICSAIAAL